MIVEHGDDRVAFGMAIDGWYDGADRLRFTPRPWRHRFAEALSLALGFRRSYRVAAVDADAGTVTLELAPRPAPRPRDV